MKRSSTVLWNGAGKDGKGIITSQSKALSNASYAWNTRYADEKGTNPEELIAAAHAACFSMKLAFVLNEAGYTADEIESTATVTLAEKGLTESHLKVNAKVPGINEEQFLDYAEKAKSECPVSKALNVEITMEATIEQPTNV